MLYILVYSTPPYMTLLFYPHDAAQPGLYPSPERGGGGEGGGRGGGWGGGGGGDQTGR